MITAGTFGCRCSGFKSSIGWGWPGAVLGWDRRIHEHLGVASLFFFLSVSFEEQRRSHRRCE